MTYDEKQAVKRAGYAAKAVKLEAQAQAAASQASLRAAAIPFGQPIMIGHHSEGRDRNYRAKIMNGFHKAHELAEEAQECKRKAEREPTAISSDDENAVPKLQAQLDRLLAQQINWKQENVEARKLRQQLPIQSFQLTNLNANIKRIEGRIELLTKMADRTDQRIEKEGFVIVCSTADNRVMFEFDEKPTPETVAILKQHAFKFSPTRGAWIRQWTENTLHAAREIAKILTEKD